MRLVGLDVTLAPVVDLDPGPESPVLGTRCFGDDPQRVADIALSWLRGLSSTGVRGCMKHYPGHGATRLDSHLDLPRIAADEDACKHHAPFAMIADRWRAEDGPPPAILTAHIVRESAIKPVTLDQAALAKVPRGLGPIWTDSLEMDALSRFGGIRERGEAAAAAGADLLVVGADLEGGLDLARELTVATTDRVLGWGASREVPQEIPEAWPEAEIERAAAAGFRMLQEQPMPEGEWDWILPVDFGAYGTVAAPTANPEGRRRISRLLRYEFDDADSLLQAVSADAKRPALVGWIHRGLPDSETQEILEAHRPRVRAVAHLLDAPDAAVVPGVWVIDACGFGEGEVASLERVWKEALGP
jgi:beta-glucosidase-like glycosyl hydrolase